MKIGMMTSDLSGETLDFIKAIGVNHICAVDHRHSGYDELGYWDPEPMEAMRKHVEAHGIQLDMVALPLPAANVDRRFRSLNSSDSKVALPKANNFSFRKRL